LFAFIQLTNRAVRTPRHGIEATGATTVTMEAVTQIKKEKNDVTGPRGNYAPSEITTDLVQKEILKVLDAIFSAR